MDIEGQKAAVLRVLLIRLIPGPGDHRRPPARFDLRKVAPDCRPDTLLREQRVPSAGILEAILAPQAKSQPASMMDLIAHVFHQQEEMTQVVGVLDGGSKVRLQQGAEGGLPLGLPQPFHIADRLRRFPGQEDGQAVRPAEPV